MRHQPFAAFISTRGTPCPYCGGATLCPSPRQLSQTIEITERQEALVLAGFRFAGRADQNGFARQEKDIFADLFDDADGGPEPYEMYRVLRTEFEELVPLVQPLGMYFALVAYSGLTLRLAPDPRILNAPAKSTSPPGEHLPAMPCPICTRHIAFPNIEQTMHRCRLMPWQRKWVRAANSMGGQPVSNEMIVASRYRNEEQAPSPARQRRNLIEAFSEINKRLDDERAGFSIRNMGYRQGYKICYGRAA